MRVLAPNLAFMAIVLIATLSFSPTSSGTPYTEDQVRAALAATLRQTSRSAEESAWHRSLAQVYSARAFAPLWFLAGRPTSQATALVSELNNAAAWGLRAADYGVHNLAASNNIAQADVSLSLAAARFVSDLHSGRISPRDVGYDLEVATPPFDSGSVVATLARAPSVTTTLNEVEPQLLHYRLLKDALARYRRLETQPELTRLPDPGRSPVRPGAAYAGTPALRKLLVALGDLPGAAAARNEDLHLDDETVRALKVFQGRHGLTQDGALGRETYSALTTPFADRVRQIELSLERWRWLPAKLGTPSIFVNIPQFRLFALYTTADIEQQMLRMDVIVGKSFPMMQTPIFAADMRYLVLHPYWDVPYGITRRELLPLIRRDPDYIERNDYEILQGQTLVATSQGVTPQTLDALARGTLRLRQKPGPKNPLGFVKFVFPNQHDVYLHGTSAPALFGSTRRAFSHGCVRVADPMGLMGYVLRNNPEWSRERLEEQLQSPEPFRINLAKPIPVFIVYTTALAAEDGRTLFFKDLYGHDGKLQALLDSHSRQLLHQAR